MKTYFACVYGGASENIDAVYKNEVERLGRIIADSGVSLIYGAGATGCMGAVARGVTAAGGYVMGTTPKFMGDFEQIYPCDNLVIVDTMNERKMIMEKHADLFIIVPGGVGTMDEFFQVLTLKHLKQIESPIVLVNINGYYDSLVAFMNNVTDKNFAGQGVYDLFDVVDSVDDPKLIKYLENVKMKKN